MKQTSIIDVKKRDYAVDLIRGFAVVLMIFIHSSVYYLKTPSIIFFWDYSQMAVQLFAFCSAYIFFESQKKFLSILDLIKRLRRLYLPYIYLYVLPVILIDVFITKQAVNYSKIFNLITLGTNRDVGWLVLLFTYFLFLNPLIFILYKKRLKIFYTLLFLSLLSVFSLLLFDITTSFRYTMFLPWLSISFFSLFFTKYKNNPVFVYSALTISGFIFVISRFVLINLEKSIVFTDNKYPPNIYYLSYGVFFAILLYKLFTLLLKHNHSFLVFKPLYFLSKNSYLIFFIHFVYLKLFLDFKLNKVFDWYVLFIYLLIFPTATILIVNKLSSGLFFFNIYKSVSSLRNRQSSRSS